MKSTDLSREQDVRRRDIGSGVYVELLNRDFLSLFFNPNIRDKILLRWGSQGEISGKVTWDQKGTGIATYGNTSVMRVLVITPDGAQKLRKFIEKHGTMSGVNEKLQDLTQRQAMEKILVERLSKDIKLARVIGYNLTDSRRGVAAFREKHITQPGEKYPRRSLVSDTTVDTGRVAGFALRSMPTMQTRTDIPPSNPTQINTEALAAKSKVSSSTLYGGRFQSSRLQLAIFEASNKEHNSEMVVDTFSTEVDRTDEFSHTDDKGRHEFYQPSTEPVPPVLAIGGDQNTIRSTADIYQWQNRNHTYMEEGTVDNPAGGFSSSFFIPLPAVKVSLFSPLNTLADNPLLLLGLIGVVIGSDKVDTTYSNTYETLPTTVIDNQEIENQLYGDN